MKQKYLLLALLFFLPYIILSQENNLQIIDTTQVEAIVIKINDIPEETERLGQRIIKLKEILKPSTNISEIDSLLVITSTEINNKKDTLYTQLKEINRRELKVKKVSWLNYRAQLNEYQDILKSRTDDVSKINDEIVNEILKWKKTKDKLASNNSSNDIYDGLDQVLGTLQNVLKVVHTRLDTIFIVQNGVTKVVLIVDEVISEIELAELQLQNDYFVFDSAPIWIATKIDTTILGSHKAREKLSVKQLALNTIKENKEQLKEFILLNKLPFVIQLLFILFLFLLMKRVNKNWKNKINELTNPIEVQSKIILSNPLAASLVAGVLISSFFYEALIPVFGEIHIFFILLGTFFLLPKLTNKRFNVFLSLLFLVYLLHTIQIYTVSSVYLERWITIASAVFLIIAFFDGIKVIKKTPDQFKPIFRLFKIVTPIYVTLLIISITVNVIGMTALSNLLVLGVLISTVLGIVVNLTVKVIASLTVILFKLNKTSNIEALTNMVNATHKRIQPILVWVGFFVWMLFTIKVFSLSIFFSSRINELMNTKWEIGETVISLGGILAFVGIFVVTILIAKLVATILQDDWMINVLPRGLASAISLLLRIIIVILGLYIAASAAGIDLSKLGFILGALGVGIGFGLQTIVLNFISGLILAFERPINLGDTIEVDKEFGVVTNIGVRSSTIKSYSGYESIIPNGDLISKKVNNYTLANRDRRSKLIMKTAPSADPFEVIKLFNKVASNHPLVFKKPTPTTYFNGYDIDGNLNFNLLYWTTFSDNLKTNSDISLDIFKALIEAGIDAPAPLRRIIKE
ncbi:MAG: mechanosensitive ion channel [Flavobacteriaceae bacterium]